MYILLGAGLTTLLVVFLLTARNLHLENVEEREWGAVIVLWMVVFVFAIFLVASLILIE